MDVLDHILYNAEPWLTYAVKLNILNESKDSLAGMRDRALSDPKIKAYLRDVADFHGVLVNNHKNPDLPIHKLLFLLDIGFDAGIPEIRTAVNKIMEHRDENGVYLSFTNIPVHFGGSGEDTFGWCLCDAPLLLYALFKAGADYDKYIKPGADHLAALKTATGFPCAVSKEFGKFRGPGRKDDPCPYASLNMLKLFSLAPGYRESDAAKNTAACLLSLWEHSMTRHPYMFYMGTDFRKLKAPAMWYDLVGVADVLSRFEWIKTDARFIEMVTMIKSKRDENGLYTPEAVYQKCKDWDFGQKKAPSLYLTYLCYRILERAGMNA